MEHDWFIVPTADDGIVGDETVPKYSDQVTGHSGTTVEIPPGEGLPLGGETAYVVKFYAETAADLDAIANDNADAFSMRTGGVTEGQVARFLNRGRGGRDKDFEEWKGRYRVR